MNTTTTLSAGDAAAERRSQMLRSLRLPRGGEAAAPAAAAASAASTSPAAPAAPAAALRPARRLPAWATVLLLAQAAALAGLWAARGGVPGLPLVGDAQAKAAPAAAAVQQPLQPAVAAPVAKLEASGFITATRMATVSARTMGQVSEMLVDEGSRVRRGQVLARIGDEQSQTQLRLAQAQHTAALARQQSAEAQLREAQREREREQTLRDQNFTSEARLSKAQTALETATANLATARADVDLARLQVVRQEQVLDDFIVRAPFDGVVMARNAQLGEIVAPGGAGGGYTRTGILTIVDMGSLEIVVDVNEDMITRVQPGQPVQAELYSHKGWRIAGEVLRVMPNADRAKSTVRARIKLLTDDPRILPDMAVKVQFL